MPHGDLASVVLEAARKERAKQDHVDSGQAGNEAGGQGDSQKLDKGKQRADGTDHKSMNGHSHVNGFLMPPKDGSRGLTASPEPLDSDHDQGGHSQQRQHQQEAQNGVIHEQDSAVPSGSSTPKPARKRPATQNRPSASARKLSTPFFSKYGSSSGSSSKANKQAARKQYTSESSKDPDVEDRHYYGSSDSARRDILGNSHLSHPMQTAKSSEGEQRLANNALSNVTSATSGEEAMEETKKKSVKDEDPQQGRDFSSSQPMRGPFSRLDSSRGQSMMNRRMSTGHHEKSRKSSRRSDDHNEASGSDSQRRYSVSGAHQRFAKALSPQDESAVADASTDDEQADEGRRSPRRSFFASPRFEKHAFFKDFSADDKQGKLSRKNTEDRVVSGSNRPPPRSELSRRSSHRSLSDFLRRSRGPSEPLPNGEGAQEDQEHRPALSRAQTQGDGSVPAKSRWNQLKQRLRQEKKPAELEKHLTGQELINDLSLGMISVMMLKMAFDRDEHNQHRVPVLLNYLRLRITDSVYPFHQSHALFRIELEYGDGLLKWVIYRELRDFVNLHTHYRVANVTHSLDRFPAFPKVSIPYFNFLRNQSKEKGGSAPSKSEFAKMQREAMENYLLQLIRAVMFRPEANRLCKFLELSGLSLALANKKGGSQGKQGFLRVLSSASRHKKPGFHPLELKRRHEPKWFMVRESYIVSVSEPSDTKLWDVFLFDPEFQIERPKRLYRQGLGFFADHKQKTEGKDPREDHADVLPDIQEFEGAEGIRGGAMGDPNDPSTTTAAKEDPQNLKNASAHTFYIRNAERKLKLVAKSERQMDQFIASIEKMSAKTIWGSRNRFSSFAPIRMNGSAQWLVDGRDYFWNLSRAILMAKESIYIHDWWISPELYLRRPPAENGRWRLDRLLQRKAEEGVQIFIIIYNEVSNDFTPVDSAYTKHRLADLHPNIMVQRSPNHAQTRTLLWSHHEKMCVVDETIGFMGGLDLCFGRWDTPAHVLLDDAPPVKDDLDLPGHETSSEDQSGGRGQIWPGKDYANSRVTDFVALNKPFEDMFDRTKIPREPWHDIGLQIIGQPARDLCRHFVQRWNMLLRIKNHRRFMPFLLPPSDFTARELEAAQLAGTCEMQICRSCGPWSIGTPNKIEHSIQTAYLYAIQTSKHFIYIENQFFITSTTVAGTAIENNIGNALVERIQRAHHEGIPWRAVIVIPLEPGYPMPIDHPDAGSVRLIMECQFNSICRGENSIFARLRRDGIDPNEYISFYSLRSWARMGDGTLATAAIYIHAKCMVVDDRIVIIGSANINERSQRGDRDSELACVIRDTDMIDSTMAGKPFKVGRFAHTLRIRLMREHLGVDVDAVEEEEVNMDLFNRKPVASADDLEPWDPRKEQVDSNPDILKGVDHKSRIKHEAQNAATLTGKIIDGGAQAVGLGAQKVLPDVSNAQVSALKGDKPVESAKTTQTQEDGPSRGDQIVSGHVEGKGHASTVVPTLEEKVLAETGAVGSEDDPADPGRGASESNNAQPKHIPQNLKPPSDAHGKERPENHAISDDLSKTKGQPATQNEGGVHDTRQLAKDGTLDGSEVPEDVEAAHKATRQDAINAQDSEHDRSSAQRDSGHDARTSPTKHQRMPSNVSATTAQSTREEGASGGAEGRSPNSKHWTNEMIANSNQANDIMRKHIAGKMSAYTLPTKRPVVDPKQFADPLIDVFYRDVWMAAATRNTEIFRKVFRTCPDDMVTTWAMLKEWNAWTKRHDKPVQPSRSGGKETLSGGPGGPPPPTEDDIMGDKSNPKSPTEAQAEIENQKKRAKQHLEEHFTEDEIEEMAALLEETTGQLVIYPTRFLEGESAGQNFLWSKDRIPPLAIYN